MLNSAFTIQKMLLGMKQHSASDLHIKVGVPPTYRINGVLRAEESKYIMMHAPVATLEKVKAAIPGAKSPTIVPLQGIKDTVAVHAVYRVAQAMPEVPILGVGGVTTGEDAVEFLLAGAQAVQVGTASFADPKAAARILAELIRWCRRHHVHRIAELTGAVHGTA